MSLRPIDATSTKTYHDDFQSADATKSISIPKEFTFDGAAYGRVNIPTGAIVSKTPALITSDLENLQKQVGALRSALASPEMRDALKKNGQALYTLTKIETKLAAIVLAVAVLKQAGVAAGGALRYAKDAAGAAAAIVAIPEDMATFASQFKAAIPTIGAAGAPVLAATLGVAAAASKLSTDMRML